MLFCATINDSNDNSMINSIIDTYKCPLIHITGIIKFFADTDVMSADSEVQIIIIIGASSAVAVTLVLCITMVMIAAILSHRRG